MEVEWRLQAEFLASLQVEVVVEVVLAFFLAWGLPDHVLALPQAEGEVVPPVEVAPPLRADYRSWVERLVLILFQSL
jgi:hypothetical protein